MLQSRTPKGNSKITTYATIRNTQWKTTKYQHTLRSRTPIGQQQNTIPYNQEHPKGI